MGKYTRFTDLEVTGALKLGSVKQSGSKVTTADAAAAAGADRESLQATCTMADRAGRRRRLPSRLAYTGKENELWQR